MTKDRDFKRVVRARMAATGEPYAASLAHVRGQAPPPGRTEAYDAARREQQRLVDRLFHDGRIEHLPAKRKVRAAVLLEVLPLFERDTVHAEPEVNELLRAVHDDVAYLRRELVNYHYLQRADGRYRVVDEAPVRLPSQLQEIPDWEAAWLPRFLAGAETTSIIDWRSLR